MTPALRADSVAFFYPQNGRGFGPFSLAVESGEAVLVSGPSGSGKSILARCLTGLIPHLYRGEYRGSVTINGLHTDQAPLWQLSEQAGFVFQNPAAQMLSATVEEEILFGLENLGLTVDEMALGLVSTLERFGLIGKRTRAPRTLSGGEQQKLALAAMLARGTSILVLDEPLSMLDSTSAINLVGHLAELMDEGVALVICEHRSAYLRALPHLRTVTAGESPTIPTAALLPPIPYSDTRSAPQTVEIRDLHIALGGKEIFDHFNLSFTSRHVTALVGPNGVGKTTLLRALAGFQEDGGAIHLEIGAEKPAFGMVFQNPDLQLFNGSVRDEILYRVSDPDMGWYRWLMTMLDLERYQETPPLLLSEGEKRRVALATVLQRLRKPSRSEGSRNKTSRGSVLHTAARGVLLDEPALGQDAHHKALLVRLLRALAEGGDFVLFSTHDLELAAQADHLILLGRDGVIAQGPAREVMRDDAAWQRLGMVRPSWVQVH